MTTQPQTASTGTRVIEVFEPALCCNTGVCGPDPSEQLITFTADAAHLASRGVRVVRHNLANDPHAFVNNPAANAFLQMVGSEGLPLVLVDGVTVAAGTYPDRAQLEKLAGVEPEPLVGLDLGLSAQSSGGCCGGGGAC
ncbi:arsenite efflux transporter metallochaperone ArsD [Tessaracoccus sp. OS52]|uniref:arsenite efflux transporter metallochaperone ArsD n=1 Tax=Tessaracoccus sp. OS52 TaxID=2886691 RepID=UPI001D11787F|nr:arsenite efflux transporter metallochaperone ArsD [Tessaracoccus sp. OS52]MCC2593701.1 arsenite efflux transporter metallochaperone ArsD [Tessaracoccus sp. OS52]